MNKLLSIIPVIFGLGLAAMAYPIGLIEQNVYAMFYGESSSKDIVFVASTSSQSNSNILKQDNLTASKAHKDNTTQIQNQPPTSIQTK